jgi:hypothetical protein
MTYKRNTVKRTAHQKRISAAMKMLWRRRRAVAAAAAQMCLNGDGI